jgi:hypothetical protein
MERLNNFNHDVSTH